MSQYCENCKTMADELVTIRAENAALLGEVRAFREFDDTASEHCWADAWEVCAEDIEKARTATDAIPSLKSKLETKGA